MVLVFGCISICGPAVYKPLELICKSCIENRTLLSEWKKIKRSSGK